jgi:SPP1 gp7 family putative phage head morphogenesis protein
VALSPEKAHNLAVLHRIGLSRYSTSVVHKVMALLNGMEKDLVSRLARTSNETVKGSRLEQLLTEIQAIQAQGWQVVRARLDGEVANLAGAEAEFSLKLAGIPITPRPGFGFSPLPPLEQIVAAVNARPFQGRFLKGWLDGAEEGAAARVENAIRQGFVEGRPTADIVRLIRGTKAAQYRDGILETNRRGAEAMVRTAMTHTANTAAQAAWEANSDIVKAWRFVATLDSRTTLICAGLHGKEFKLGTGPQPPRHVNCRSTSIPVLDPIEGVAAFELPSYQAWLKAQPVEVQNDILGAKRAALFRGGMPIDRFVDNKGRTLTLAQLKAQDAAGFAKTAPPSSPKAPPAAAKPPPVAKAPAKAAAPVARPRTLAEIGADHDREMRDYTLTQGRKSNTEHLVVHDAATGRAFPAVTDGKKSSVDFPSWLVDKLRDGENQIVIHHNHPSSSSFSYADLDVVTRFPGAKGIWAHGHNGSSYYAEAGQRQFTAATYNRLQGDVMKWMQAKVNSLELATEDANALFTHVIQLRVAEEGIIAYKADLQGETLAAWKRSKALIEQFLSGGAR